MRDLLRLALSAVVSHRLRSGLSMLGIGIGIASVILLTSIGEGTRLYMVGMFTQFGTNLMSVHPGKSETTGIPGALGGTTRKLTIDDALAIGRIPGVEEVVPLAFGGARVEAGGRGRSVIIYGVTPNVPRTWRFQVRQGSFWPAGDPNRGAQFAVLGPKLKRELFGEGNALGQFVRIGSGRFRVTGVMSSKGQFLGFDIDDAAYIPTVSAMKIFNLSELAEIDILYAHAGLSETVEREVGRLLAERHGEEDFTVTTQAAMLSVFDNVMNVITMAVGAIAGISLLVGAIGILTMMWIAVGERTAEIGLARAIGATRRQIHVLFLTEAAALAMAGGILGVLAGMGIAALLRLAVPGLPVHTPVIFVLMAVAVSVGTGLLSGLLPARRAAALDPIEALRAE
ncbi:MAG: putative transport system permease protein [Acidobacteriota bacterium]|jgi:putative ABC transport system permease protein|nr:putative transport system permease protein [Acidobacteriota bacterium]